MTVKPKSKIIGGIGKSPYPLIFPEIKDRLTISNPVPSERSTMLAYSTGRFLQYIATIPKANPNPPFAALNIAAICTASDGKSGSTFSFTTLGIAMKTTPIKDKITPIIINAMFVSTFVLLLFFYIQHLQHTNTFSIML